MEKRLQELEEQKAIEVEEKAQKQREKEEKRRIAKEKAEKLKAQEKEEILRRREEKEKAINKVIEQQKQEAEERERLAVSPNSLGVSQGGLDSLGVCLLLNRQSKKKRGRRP